MTRYLSVCSGIEAASVAWHDLGWTPVGFAEIDRFASAVLAERFGSNMPGEALSRNAPPNFGDFTAIPLDELGPVDLLVGGTPCQAFSFAGKRLSLADARGNLTLGFAVLAHELARSHGCRNALWENVPGVLSTDDNAFGCFLGALVGADAPLRSPLERGRWPDAGMVAGPRARAAWRLLDAQYFRLAQRRERVFVVVDLGGGADPAAVLFEPQSLRGNSAPRREAGQNPAGTLTASLGRRGGQPNDDNPADYLIAKPVLAGGHGTNPLDETLIAHTLRGEGFDASEDGTGRGTPIVPVFTIQERAVSENPAAGPDGAGVGIDVAYTLEARAQVQAIAFDTTQITSATNRSNPQPGDPCHPLAASAHPPAIAFDARQTDVLVHGDLTAPLDTDGYSVAVCIHSDALNRSGDSLTPSPDASGMVRLRPAGKGWTDDDTSFAVTTGAAHAVAVSTLQARAQSGTSNQFDGVRQGWAVRRLTPTECARLQGFPDYHSRISWRGKAAEQCPDGPQYKTYGNSMAVNVMRWLGERLDVEMRGGA